MATPEILLYTSHTCPFAHRAHIALAELGVPYKEEIIDLSVPRSPEYLKINPRGVLPSLSYDGEIITDFRQRGGALKRARINFFVDAYSTKANPFVFKAFGAKSTDEVEAIGAELVSAIVKEIEPLLKDAAPFYGGSNKLTLAEVLTGSFVIRLFSLIKYELLPSSITTGLQEKAPNFYKWSQAVIQHPSLTYIYDEKTIIDGFKKMMGKK